MAKGLPPAIAKAARKALRLSKSGIPLARIADILAQPESDISTVANRLPRVEDQELRLGFAALSRLLRELEGQLGPDSTDAPQMATPDTKEVFPTDAPTAGPDRQVDRVKIFVDGASRGNPGPASIGIVFTDMSGRVIWQVSQSLDAHTTNNVAEYSALREGLLRALGQGWKKVHVFSDSELMVKQMLGQYKIKNPALQKLAADVQRLKKRFEAFTIAHVDRAHNRLADKLAARALKAVEDE